MGSDVHWKAIFEASSAFFCQALFPIKELGCRQHELGFEVSKKV
jgi:hypothetical protein